MSLLRYSIQYLHFVPLSCCSIIEMLCVRFPIYSLLSMVISLFVDLFGCLPYNNEYTRRLVYLSTSTERKIKKTGKFTVSKLEKYLKHRGISQRFFAKQIGITPNSLNSIIKGKSIPHLLLAYEVEKKTGGLVTVYDFIPESYTQTETETAED